MKKMLRTVQEQADAQIHLYGGIRAAARALKMDHAYLAKLSTGERDNPSDATLRKLGLLTTPFYLVSTVKHTE